MPDDEIMRDPMDEDEDDLLIPKPLGPNGEPIDDEDDEEDEFEEEPEAL